jgi:hypothetical protein
MAYAARPSDFHRPVVLRRAPQAKSVLQPGLLRRLFDAVFVSRERQAERDVALYLARTGRLTDSVEREMSERIFRSDWTRPR